MLEQQIKCSINRQNISSTDKKLDQHGRQNWPVMQLRQNLDET